MRLVLRFALALVAIGSLAVLALWWALAPPTPHPAAARGATLVGVTLVEPGLARRSDVTLTIEGGRIESIESTQVDDEADAGGVDTVGAFVLPGLIDMHVHYPPATGLPQADLFSLLYLRHGVTSVRDLGDPDGTARPPALAGSDDGAFASPRIFACGPFVDGEDGRWPNTRVVRTPADARDAVAEMAATGSDCIKVYDGLPAAGLAATVQAARAHGLPVVGHVSREVAYADSGIGDVQHFTRAAAFDRVDPRPFPEGMEAWTELDQATLDRIVAHALATNTVNTPTLVSTERLSRQDDYEGLRREPDAQLVPRFYRDVVWRPPEGERSITPEQLGYLKAYVPVAQRLLKRLHDAGARVHVGTDVLTSFVVPGASLWRELALFVDAGLTPEQALALATRGNGADLPLPALGRVETGAPADLIVLRRDPTMDLDALESLEAVVVDGRLYSRAELDAQLARYQSWFQGAVFDAVSVELAERAMARLFDDR